MRRMIFPDVRYGAGTVPVQTRISRVLRGEMSGAVYICSREKTHHASARSILDLQYKTGKQLDHWTCEVGAPEGAPHPFRVPTTRTFSRLRRV